MEIRAGLSGLRLFIPLGGSREKLEWFKLGRVTRLEITDLFLREDGCARWLLLACVVRNESAVLLYGQVIVRSARVFISLGDWFKSSHQIVIFRRGFQDCQ